MADWSSSQYLKFKSQRTQPAIDLAKRISFNNPKSILDIGCGPGNSSEVLKNMFPNASVLGIDSSSNMIQKAKSTHTNIEFQLCDIVSDIDKIGNYDIIFSNACLQWISNHKNIIPALFNKLNKKGVLAVQMPMNLQEPLFKVIASVVSDSKWGFDMKTLGRADTLTPEEYFDILSSCTEKFDVWETVYYHSMESVRSMIEWVKSTRLKPYLDVLDEEKKALLEQEITECASTVYKCQVNGEVIMKFRRFFFTAINV